MLENLDKIMHLRFNFDACPMHSPFRFVHLTHQNLSARALFCLNSLAKVNTQLLIFNLPCISFQPGLFDSSNVVSDKPRKPRPTSAHLHNSDAKRARPKSAGM